MGGSRRSGGNSEESRLSRRSDRPPRPMSAAAAPRREQTMEAAAAPRSKEASSPSWSFTQPSRKPAMKVSPAPTVSTTLVGKPGTRVMFPPGSTAAPPPGPSVITASPKPVLFDPTAGQLDWIATALAGATAGRLGKELDVLVTCLDDPLTSTDHPEPGLHLAPVHIGIGDHGRPHVDVVGDPRLDVAHPVEQHLRTRTHDARQGRNVQPVVAVQLRQIVDLPAEVRRVVEVERVARDPLFIQTHDRDRGGL